MQRTHFQKSSTIEGDTANGHLALSLCETGSVSPYRLNWEKHLYEKMSRKTEGFSVLLQLSMFAGFSPSLGGNKFLV